MFAENVLRKDLISSRAAPGRLVVRPDSGDPKTIVVDVLNRLGKCFGFRFRMISDED
jgi:nicotinic acid phosphoribosyltransferase